MAANRTRPLSYPRWLLAGLLAGVLAGCGTGAYRERMEKRLEELSRGVPGQDMLTDASPLPGTPLEFRLPLAFQVALSPAGGQEKAQRRMPPITVPGVRGAWEAHVEQGGLKQPYYFYLGLAPKSPDPREAIRREIQGQWPDVRAQWEDFTDAAGRPWKRFRADLADLDWVALDGAGKETAPQQATGIVEFYCREEAGQWIVAGWRVQKSLASQVRLDGLISPTLANLTIK